LRLTRTRTRHMRIFPLTNDSAGRAGPVCAAALLLCASANCVQAQQAPPPHTSIQPPDIAATATVSGVIADTDGAAISTAQVALQDAESNATHTAQADAHGVFSFSSVPAGRYALTVHAPGFASWKIKNILVVLEGENVIVPEIQLGVEEISTTVNAISVEDLAEQQITTEEHQRILAVLPNFYVSYVSDAAPLTRKQKFKLAVVVSRDPVTYLTTGISAGIEQWQGDFAGYGQGFSGYAQRYAATYGDKLSSTFLGAALLPSLLHQDPRYFYRGHGHVIVRALYAISTVAVCKGDNGRWQPNYSNVLGNLGSAGISTLYYPSSDQHSVQVTVTNTLIGVAEGAIGTLFQEFLLRHLTHGAPAVRPAQP
jgi:Carboxypeptidase regulatory-like domain